MGSMADAFSLLDATAQAELVRRGAVTPLELVDAAIARIEKLDPELGAVITRQFERARAAAVAPDLPQGPFRGVPMLLKDLGAHLAGDPVHCGMRALKKAGWREPGESYFAERLRLAGLISLGRTNTPELGLLPTTEPEAYGPTRNPWKPTHSSGGSSGGSAAAVAAGLAAAALGTDTGGSIRQPAAFCGDVGLKPTYGRVSRYGLIAFASSLDQIGPLARDVEDAALILQVIAGHDPLDSTSVDVPVPDYRADLGKGVEGLRIGIPAEYFIEGLDPEVEAAVRAAIQQLEKLGAQSEPVSLPHTEYGLAAYYLIAPAEASSNLARYDGVKYGLRMPRARDLIEMYSKTRAAGFGAEVKRRVMLGTYALSAGYYDAYYGQAQKVRTVIAQEHAEAFEHFDVLVSPTSPTVAFRLGEKAENPLAMYLSDVLTIPSNMAGLPGLSIPCGLSEGLPVGLQLIGPQFSENTLFRVGHALEQAIGFDYVPGRLA
jgi:aspartyl-tRNA(Asn)/glutamyl-tRNA(Gln) amidotransferase subunit A